MWVDTKMQSCSVTTRPTLFEVSTVPGIASLIFTTPCGICSRLVSNASTASRLTTVSCAWHRAMVQRMPGSLAA